MNKNLITVLVFILIIFILFWMMPDSKIITIGNFVDLITNPVTSIIIGVYGVTDGVIKKVIDKNKKDD